MSARRKLPAWWWVMAVVYVVAIIVALIAALTGNWNAWRINSFLAIVAVVSFFLIFRQAMKDTDPTKRKDPQ